MKPKEDFKFYPFEKKLNNKTLLFQGVKNFGVANVLRNGHKIPHKDSPEVAYQFGRALYFTDCFSKAA
jgi:hypothetical protein